MSRSESDRKCVLLTGAAGFLGRHALQRLAREYTVIAITRRNNHLLSSLSSDLVSHVVPIVCDLTDANAVDELLDQVRPNWVWHLAGYAEGLQGPEHLLPSFHGDLQTTVNLLAASVGRVQERVLIIGSLEEPDGGPIASPYAVSKFASVEYGRMCRELYGLPVAIARIFMTYGSGQRERKLIPYVIRTLLQGEVPQLGNGDRLVDWIYVSDVIEGLIHCSTHDAALSAPSELGTGELISIRELVQTICELIGTSIEPQYNQQPPRQNERVRAARVIETQRHIKWQPVVSLREGLRMTIEAYLQTAHKA